MKYLTDDEMDINTQCVYIKREISSDCDQNPEDETSCEMYEDSTEENDSLYEQIDIKMFYPICRIEEVEDGKDDSKGVIAVGSNVANCLSYKNEIVLEDEFKSRRDATQYDCNKNVKKHKCSFCAYVTNHTGHLKRHINTVHKHSEEHSCNLCDFKSDRESLRRHINSVHHESKKFKCHSCDYATDRKSHIRRHIDSKHVNSKQIICNLCDFIGTNEARFRKHMNFVHLKKHQCDLCDYVTDRQSHLKRHKDCVHMKSKEYKRDLNNEANSEHINSTHSGLGQFYGTREKIYEPQEKVYRMIHTVH